MCQRHMVKACRVHPRGLGIDAMPDFSHWMDVLYFELFLLTAGAYWYECQAVGRELSEQRVTMDTLTALRHIVKIQSQQTPHGSVQLSRLCCAEDDSGQETKFDEVPLSHSCPCIETHRICQADRRHGCGIPSAVFTSIYHDVHMQVLSTPTCQHPWACGAHA